jgi:hypothetical protein
LTNCAVDDIDAAGAVTVTPSRCFDTIVGFTHRLFAALTSRHRITCISLEANQVTFALSVIRGEESKRQNLVRYMFRDHEGNHSALGGLASASVSQSPWHGPNILSGVAPKPCNSVSSRIFRCNVDSSVRVLSCLAWTGRRKQNSKQSMKANLVMV